ncbi:MAG: serine protease [Clostridiales bacterium]|nr:serine protease [Clostridiales bacterium]
MEVENKKLSLYKIITIIMIVVGFLAVIVVNIFNDKTIVNLEKINSNGALDTYKITYSNGTTSNFTVESDKVTIYDIYNSLKEAGYNYSYSEFLKEYLNYETTESNKTVNINKALLSSVSVYSEFEIIKKQPVYTETPFGSMVTSYKDVKDTAIGAGSGIIYDLDIENGNAYIITNYHVVFNKDAQNENNIGKINVFLYGSNIDVKYLVNNNKESILNEKGYPTVTYGKSAIECEYIGGSLNYDIAVLKITNSNVLKQSNAKEVNIASSYKTNENNTKIVNSYVVGQTAIAIGNPEAQGISVTEGVVSVDSEYMQMYGADESTVVTFRTMRIDTAINSGNSGGGLFNEKGELIGIVNAKIVAEDIENIAYAIPRDIVVNVAENLIYNSSNLKVNRMMLGMSLIGENSIAKFDNETQTTYIYEDVMIESLDEGSIAENLGFKTGDKINSITINDVTYTFNRMYNVIDLSLNIRLNDNITYNLTRNGQMTTLSFVATSEFFSNID